MKKKVISSVLACAMFSTVVLGSGMLAGAMNAETVEAKTEKTESDVEYIKEKGTLVVGITDFAPMDYQNDDGEWIGFDADLAKKVAEDLGVEAEFVEIDWDNKILELDNKSIDVVWNGMTYTDEVATSMNCTEAYCNNAQVVVVPADVADQYTDEESLADLNFAVESGSAGAEVCEENGYEYTSVTAQADALMEVSAGTSDASIIDLLMAGALIGEGTSYPDLAHTVEMTKEEYVVGCRKDSDLADFINDEFDAFYEDGSMQEVAYAYGIQDALTGQDGMADGEDFAEASAEEYDGDLGYIQEKGTLVVGITDFAPMDYQNDDGEWIGFDADLAKKVAEDLGVEAEFIEIDWDNKILELDNKSIDVVWNGMTYTDEVATSMNCTNAYCNNAQVVVVPSEVADQYTDEESLMDLSFAVESGSAGAEVCEENGYNYTSVTAQADALMEVSAGTSDASIIDLLMAGALIGEGTSYPDLAHTVELTTEEYVVGCRKESNLADFINDEFAKFYEDGSMEEVAVAYGIQDALVDQTKVEDKADTEEATEEGAALEDKKETTFASVTLSLCKGFLGTLKLFLLTLLFALPLGLLISLGSLSKAKIIRYPVKFIIWIIRGTPLLLQLLIIYYGPGIILGNNVWGTSDGGRFIAALVAFVINYSCYFSEIYRGGIQSVPQGQYEAGQVLGLTKGQIFKNIVLLQVIKKIIPPISNEIITLVKDTSLARIIAVYEIIWNGQAFIKSAGIIWPLFYTGAFYLIFSGLLTILFQQIEKKLDYFR